MIAIDLSKQQALDADPKAIQQINFAGNLPKQAKFLLPWERSSFRFFTSNCKLLLILFFALI